MFEIAPIYKTYNYLRYDRVFVNRKPTKSNALKVIKHYKKKGYNARLAPVILNGKRTYQVYVRRKK